MNFDGVEFRRDKAGDIYVCLADAVSLVANKDLDALRKAGIQYEKADKRGICSACGEVFPDRDSDEYHGGIGDCHGGPGGYTYRDLPPLEGETHL